MTNPLNYIEKYPDRTKQIIGIDRQMGEESLTEHELIVDSWEQARERPGDVRIQVLEAIFRGTFISLNSCK